MNLWYPLTSFFFNGASAPVHGVRVKKARQNQRRNAMKNIIALFGIVGIMAGGCDGNPRDPSTPPGSNPSDTQDGDPAAPRDSYVPAPPSTPQCENGWLLVDDVGSRPVIAAMADLEMAFPYLAPDEHLDVPTDEMFRRAREIGADLGQAHAEWVFARATEIPDEFQSFDAIVFSGTIWVCTEVGTRSSVMVVPTLRYDIQYRYDPVEHRQISEGKWVMEFMSLWTEMRVSHYVFMRPRNR
jgi:hypothetical protein